MNEQVAALMAKLTKLRWSRAELARRLGVTKHTVYRWTRGEHPVPAYAITVLDELCQLAEVRDSVTKKLETTEPRKEAKHG